MTKAASCVWAAFLAVASLGPGTVVAQESAPETLPVYLDCEWVCDFDHVRREIRWADGLRQPWGSVNTSLQVAHLMGWSLGADVPPELADQDAKYRAVLSGRVELGLVKGLSLDVGGFYTRVRDQVSLRRGEASDEEVLLRLRQLETSYRYFISVGFRYSFGSIYNNVVNTRFGGSNPGGFVFIN